MRAGFGQFNQATPEYLRFAAQYGATDVLLNRPNLPNAGGKWELQELVKLRLNVEGYGNPRKVFGKPRDQLGHDRRCEARDGDQTQVAGTVFPNGMSAFHDLIKADECPRDLIVKGPPLVGGDQLPVGPAEQLKPDLLLEIGEHSADRRLRYGKNFGRPGDRAGDHDAPERFYLTKSTDGRLPRCAANPLADEFITLRCS